MSSTHTTTPATFRLKANATSKGESDRRRDRVTTKCCGLLAVVLVLSAVFAAVVSVPRAANAQGPGFPPGPGGGGPMMPQELEIVDQFDKNKDKRLDTAERKTAREWLATNHTGRRGFGGRGGRGGRGMGTGSPGRALTPADVRTYTNEPLYDPRTLRTIFLQFENADWEQELADFNNTDVEVPATAIVDGKTYKNVGVHFRGMSSFMNVPAGLKRSLNLSFDFVDEQQSLNGYRTLNVLNANSDPTFVRALLYSDIARSYIPAPKVNFMRVAINGESWGVYVNAQQYNKDFLRDFFATEAGARWKVPGNPGARRGMEYLGEDASVYKRIYDLRTKDTPKVWADLIRMFRVLNETPPDKLEAALARLLDIDGALKFLAIEMALVNSDGYWTRASDYCIYQDPKGQFHVIPHDMNEALVNEGGRGGRGGRFMMPIGEPGGGPPDFVRGGPPPDQGGFPPEMGGRRGPPGGGPGFGPGGGPELDPLVGLNDPTKPLRSKLLAVPVLRARYLGYVRDIAQRWLDWNKLEPLVKQYQSVIADEVKVDTRKLYSTEDFDAGTFGDGNSLRRFVQQRREFLLKVTESRDQMK